MGESQKRGNYAGAEGTVGRRRTGGSRWQQHSLWLLLPAAAVIVISWLRGRGRKQGEPPETSDDDERRSPERGGAVNVDGGVEALQPDDFHALKSEFDALMSKYRELDDRKPPPAMWEVEESLKSFHVSEDRLSLAGDETTSLLPEFNDLVCEFDEPDTKKLERFKTKPRAFMTGTTKK